MKFTSFLTVVLFLSLSACTKAEPPAPAPAPPPAKIATIKDIMDSMVDPSADFLFESVAEIADANGITHKAPHTDEEWDEVRYRAIVLLEAPNLLIMEGRKVANPGDKSKNPEIELEPAQIQELVEKDRAAFVRRARRLQNAAAEALKGIEAKDKDALFRGLNTIDQACENCHLHYWYPNDKRARQAAKEDGLVID